MGLLIGEGRILKLKYMKTMGLTESEAINKVSEFIDQLNKLKVKMQQKNKSELEIKQKEQEIFEREFQKLCSYE